MPEIDELKRQLTTLCSELDKRKRRSDLLNPYFDGECPLPKTIVRAQLTNAYRLLMPMATSPWGRLIVNAVKNRLEVSGIRSDNRKADDAVWGFWQDNFMDSESKLAHTETFIDGRTHALVWTEDDQPSVWLDNASQAIVQYREGSRHRREAAVRRWIDDFAVPHATLYRREGIYKFVGPRNSSGMAGTQWMKREVADEPWPIPNPLGVVPVVELGVNRRLKPGSFTTVQGEYEAVTGHIDRINILVFLGLVVAFWSGFPVRGVIGDKILRDDSGDVLPPFELNAQQVVQFENPEAKVFEFKGADLKNFSVVEQVEQLATLTDTPRHYFPLGGGMSNLSADAIRASEAALNGKVNAEHKPSLGEGWEEVLRLGGMMLDRPVQLSPRAELTWKDHESRSLAERADAASKFGSLGLPWPAIAELALNASQEQIGRWTATAATNPLGELLRQVQEEPVTADPAMNGAS